MNMLFLFLTSNAACILIGWVLGRTGRNAAVVAAAVEDTESGDPPRAGRTHPFQSTLAWVMVGISAVTALNGFTVAQDQASLREDQARHSACVTRVVNQLTEALLARSDATQETNRQQDRIWFTVAEAYQSATPDAAARVRAAIEEYVKARTDAIKASTDNPLPDPPRDVCRN